MTIISSNHFHAVAKALERVDDKEINATIEAIQAAPMVLVGGNGGSAATAIHFAADLRSLGFNAWDMLSPSKVTQLGNDEGFASIFSSQARLCPEALVILFSGSGTSDNIERVFYAHDNIILWTSTMRPIKLHGRIYKVDSKDYEVIEDVHLAICHAIKKELKVML